MKDAETLLALFVARTVVTGVLLWAGIKVVAFHNEKNSILRTLGVAAIGCAISFYPVWPLWVLGSAAVASILFKAYELEIGQTIAVMCFAVLGNAAVFKALGDLLARL